MLMDYLCNLKTLMAIQSLISAIFLGYIAWQQMKINKDKLKYELYNKRFEVLTKTIKFYQGVVYEKKVSEEIHQDFIAAKTAAYFLFSKDKSIYSILDEMHKNSFKIKHFKEKSQEYAKKDPIYFQKANSEHDELLKWFRNEVPILKGKMRPYLEQK